MRLKDDKGTTVKLGDIVELETTSGEKFKLPCVEIVGNRTFFDDGYSRLQMNNSTGSILILNDGRGGRGEKKVIMKEVKNLILENKFSYHKPFGDQLERYEKIRSAGLELAKVVDSLCPKSSEKSLAMTKIEEVIMWSNKSIAINEKE